MTKPSKVKHITAKYAWWLPKAFAAMTVCGIVYTSSKKAAEEMNKTGGIDNFTEAHEMIHVKQAVSTSDSWLCFYFRYLCQYIHNLPLLFVNKYAPYKFLAFELEAYAHGHDIEYAKREKCEEWKEYRKIKLKDLRLCAKEWYGDKQKYQYNFGYFVRTYVRQFL